MEVHRNEIDSDELLPPGVRSNDWPQSPCPGRRHAIANAIHTSDTRHFKRLWLDLDGTIGPQR